MSLPELIETGFQSPLFEEAVKRQGVMYVPGELCYSEQLAARNQMRLSFGVLAPERIREGMRRLSVAVRNIVAQQG